MYARRSHLELGDIGDQDRVHQQRSGLTPLLITGDVDGDGGGNNEPTQRRLRWNLVVDLQVVAVLCRQHFRKQAFTRALRNGC
ncbi:hypothetical protein D3C72_2299990 [compost metagenome]